MRNCFTWNIPPQFWPLYVPFRLQLVILTHRHSRAHQRSCAVSEESSHWKGQAVVLVGKLLSIQAPQSVRKRRIGGLT